MQYRVWFKLFRSVEIIPVSGKDTAAVSAQRLGHVDHTGIELTDPLHFIIIIDRFAKDVLTVYDL